MNQRFRVLRDLGEQFEHAADAQTIDREMSPTWASRPTGRLQRISRSRLALAGIAAVATAALIIGLVLGSGSNESGTRTAQGEEAAFVSQFPVLALHQTAAARAQANSGPAGTLNEEESTYPVLTSPQSSAARSGAKQGIAPTLNASPSFAGGGSGPKHYLVRFVGKAKYQNVPSLTREVTVHGVQVWFFVVYLPITHALPKAIVSGNDPKGAQEFTSKRYLAQQRRLSNEFAGYQLYARVGSKGRPELVYSRTRDLKNRTSTEQHRFLGLRQFANATLPGPGGTIVAVVPGDVARLSWSWPREFDSSALSFVPATTLSAAASDDVSVAAAPARFNTAEQILPETVTYYNTSKSVIGRYRNGSAREYLTTTYDGSTPGPETDQSRRAEINPATPNRVVIVSIKPTTLQSMRRGPAVEFLFKVLLNHRRYYLRVTGGPHPGCIRKYIDGKLADGNGTLDHPLAAELIAHGVGVDEATVRGDTYEDGLPFTIDCVGTYKLSVSVAQPDGIPYKPFGSATFTVRR